MNTKLINTNHYSACDDCAYYLATGDSSAIEIQDYSDEKLAEIDATQGAITRYGCGDHWLESTRQITATLDRCTFCGENAIITQQVAMVTR